MLRNFSLILLPEAEKVVMKTKGLTKLLCCPIKDKIISPPWFPESIGGQSQKINGLITGFEMKSLGVLEVIQKSSCTAQNQLQQQIIHKQPEKYSTEMGFALVFGLRHIFLMN